MVQLDSPDQCQAGRGEGHVDRENCPVLSLATFVPGAPWRDIDYTDQPIYELFRWAYYRQDGWDITDSIAAGTPKQHQDFWRATLPLWPRKTGQRQHTDQLVLWAGRLIAHGATQAEVESLLGYSNGSLTRMGVFRELKAIKAAWADVPVITADQIPRAYVGRRVALAPQRVQWAPFITAREAPRFPPGTNTVRLGFDPADMLSQADRDAFSHIEALGRRALGIQVATAAAGALATAVDLRRNGRLTTGARTGARSGRSTD